MRGYAKVWHGIWKDKDFMAMSDAGRYAFFFILTGPYTTRDGRACLPDGSVSADALKELYCAEIIDWDEGQQVRIHKWFNCSRLTGGMTGKPHRWIPKWLRNLIFERDGHQCVYCGAEQQLQLDHKTPVSRGGETETDNLVTACKPCNTSKGPRLLSEWRA